MYIATDEKNKTYFDPIREHYKLYFMDDFTTVMGVSDPHLFGMIDQLVASRGEIFVGSYYSTFTGFINRIRGYHTQRKERKNNYDGSILSYYYTPETTKQMRQTMKRYHAIRQPLWVSIVQRTKSFYTPVASSGRI